jgi:two-component system chemotaxis response regulator CheY
MRILLVDDSKTMRNIQKSVLSQLGSHQIEEACDGQDALSKVGAFQPQLLLVDWNMPNMDGSRSSRPIGSRTRPRRSSWSRPRASARASWRPSRPA